MAGALPVGEREEIIGTEYPQLIAAWKSLGLRDFHSDPAISIDGEYVYYTDELPNHTENTILEIVNKLLGQYENG